MGRAAEIENYEPPGVVCRKRAELYIKRFTRSPIPTVVPGSPMARTATSGLGIARTAMEEAASTALLMPPGSVVRQLPSASTPSLSGASMLSGSSGGEDRLSLRSAGFGVSGGFSPGSSGGSLRYGKPPSLAPRYAGQPGLPSAPFAVS